jgi:hypothetical protein
MNEQLLWLEDLNNEIKTFLSHQRSVIRKGYFSYSYSGDIYDEKTHWNVGSAVFALKLYYLLGFKKDKEIIDTIEYIKSFMDKDGFIYDPFIYKKGFLRNFAASLKNRTFDDLLNNKYKKAETRQAYSALMLYDEVPKNINMWFPKDKKEIEDYLSKLNWNEPWGAGSHFSHLMFFIRLAYKSSNIDKQKFEELRGYGIDWINTLLKKDTGGWYKGKLNERYIVNGAMKILTGLIAVEKYDFEYPKELIDTCLKTTNDLDACDNFNIILVLNYASKLLNRDYRQKEIEKFALNRLLKYKAHYKKDQGGFSFFLNSSNNRYYGAKITKGLNEADIHGTVLFMWGISIIVQILRVEDQFCFREFIT